MSEIERPVMQGFEMQGFERIAKSVEQAARTDLEKCGIFFRVFWRVKTAHSLQRKIVAKGYTVDGRRAVDVIGVRIVCYFSDDISLVDELLCRRFGAPEERVRDDLAPNTFEPTRLNIVFKIPDSHRAEIQRYCDTRPIAPTFEIQLRTVLSEGWHEIDHDLRYKNRGDWQGQADLDRALNGILATLETSDWTTLQLFDELALRHYRDGRWPAMLRARLRLRLIPSDISASLKESLDHNKDLAKAIFRADRRQLVQALARSSNGMPMTIDNSIFLVNLLGRRDDDILEATPYPIREEFEAIVAEGG